jgi:hypothetical protein
MINYSEQECISKLKGRGVNFETIAGLKMADCKKAQLGNKSFGMLDYLRKRHMYHVVFVRPCPRPYESLSREAG